MERHEDNCFVLETVPPPEIVRVTVSYEKCPVVIYKLFRGETYA